MAIFKDEVYNHNPGTVFANQAEME